MSYDLEKCIFCNKNEISEERAFPVWLMQRYAGKGTVTYQNHVDAPIRRTHNRPLRIRRKCVCKGCNNGWMSIIQNNAKPIIETLLDSEASPIGIQECKALMLWAVMTTMVLESFNVPETWRYTELDRCLISDKRDQLPPATYVWLARWIDSPGPSFIKLVTPDGYPERAFLATLAFGTLVFQILKLVPKNGGNKLPGQKPGPWNETLFQVYPPQSSSMEWSPLKAIRGEGGLHALQNRFGDPETQI
jgi:hypothetical protein